MIRLFVGHDPRESIGTAVFTQSVLETTKAPVSITHLTPFLSIGQRDGTNAFTYSRFLVPALCDYQGWAIFADGADMLCKADLEELWSLRDPWKAVQVVKHEYQTKHPRKYIGTQMEAENRDYPRKNWSSLILWNCGHLHNRKLSPGYAATANGSELHRFAWLTDDRIGEIPKGWNWLADEYGHAETAKILHWTAGIPGIRHYSDSPHANEWTACLKRALRAGT